MNITKEFLISKNACDEGIKYFKINKLENISAIDLINRLREESPSWANWLITRLLTKENLVRYAIYSAELVLHIYEAKYPKDDRPRKAIEAAKRYLETKEKPDAYAAAAAADAAYAAAYAADAYAAADAAYAAADAADAYAAADAAYAYADAAYVAAAAADAADAADAAADRYKTYVQIIDYGIELLNNEVRDE
jgi:hypothetical protein